MKAVSTKFSPEGEKHHLKILTCIISFFLIGFMLYKNVWHGEFVSDDYPFLVNNYSIRDVNDVYRIWESFPTRFLLMYSYALNYYWGGLNVLGYHLLNIFIHTVNTALVFLLTLLILRTPDGNEAERIPHQILFAYFTALIFLCHPMQTQAVSYIAQRGTTLSSLFYLLTVIFYIKSRTNNFYYFLSIVFLCLGGLSKENIVTAPVVIFLYEIFFNGTKQNNFVPALKRVLPYLLPMMVIILCFHSEKKFAVAALNEQLTQGYFSWNYFLTEINVLISYLRLFIFPVNQCHVYEYPISPGLADARTLFSLAGVLLLLSSMVYFYRAGKRRLSFFTAWYFVTLSVEFVIVTFVHMGVLYDHWLYLASVGLAFITVSIFYFFIKDLPHLRVALVLVIATLSLLTFQRNKIWANEIIFWQDVVKKAPHDYTGRQFLTLALFRKGQNELALQQSSIILRNNPDDTQILNNLGIYYSLKGNHKLALKYFKKAIAVDPACFPAYNNIADTYQRIGQHETAVQYYQQAIKINPQSPTAYYLLGKCYINLGQNGQASQYLQRAKALYQKRHQNDKINAIDDLRRRYGL